MTSCDVAVIGGGVIGAACARAAALRGLSVALFEPGASQTTGAASPASAGMLAAQIEPGDDAWLLDLCVRGRELYAPLAAALQGTTGLIISCWLPGIASVAFDDATAQRLRTAVAQERRAGLDCEWLDAGEVRRRWPGAAPECHGALFAPRDGAVDPAALTRALLADAQRLGATVVAQRVRRVTVAGATCTGVATDTATTTARHVVVAAGAWSPLVAGLPHHLPVEPVRGQLVMVPWPAGTPAAILYAEHGYILARGGYAILGSTMERVGFDATATAAGQADIIDRTKRLLPAIAGVPVTRTWAGLRPMSPDGRPIVGPDPDLAGLWYATGHGRNGVLLAALTGDIIGELLTTGATAIDIAPMQPRQLTAGR